MNAAPRLRGRTIHHAIAMVCLSLLPAGGARASQAQPDTSPPAVLKAELPRPDAGAGPTPVSVGIWLADVSKIDSAAQTFSANLFVVLRWKDSRLAHHQPGVKSYALRDIWNPNLLIANAAGKVETALAEIAEVSGDGMVSYRQRFIGSFTEAPDLRAFPFDRASFGIQLIGVGYGPSEVRFVPDESLTAFGIRHGGGIAPVLTLRDWRITGFATRTAPYRLGPGLEAAGYRFEFQAGRLPQHYLLKVILPLVLIVMMSWMVFWIDRSLGNSQISLASTSMLTLIAYRFSIGSEVPRLPYLTDLDAFILVSTVMVFLALIEVVATTALWTSDRKDLARHIDRWCQVAFPVAFVVLNAAIVLH